MRVPFPFHRRSRYHYQSIACIGACVVLLLTLTKPALSASPSNSDFTNSPDTINPPPIRIDEPELDDAEESTDADSQTLGLWLNLSVGSIVTALCLLLFDPLRRKFPEIFETRRKLHEDKDPVDYSGNRVTTPPAPSYKPLGWLMPTLRLDAEKLTDTHGLDAALFLRYHSFMFALFSALLLPSTILLPVFWSGPKKDLPKWSPQRAIGITRFSIGNLKTADPWRFWMILTLEYFIMGFVCYFLFYHFTLYCRDRRRYRSGRHPANYAILVQDVPYGARNAQAVNDYWNKVFPNEIATVLYVHDARKLEKWKAKFWEAVTQREIAEWRMHHTRKVAKEKEQKKQERLQKRARKGQRMWFGRRTQSEDIELQEKGEHNFKISKEAPNEGARQRTQSSIDEDSFFRGAEAGVINDVELAEMSAGSYNGHNNGTSSNSPTAPQPVYRSSADVAIETGEKMYDTSASNQYDSSSITRDEEILAELESRRCLGVFPKTGPPKDPRAAVVYWESIQRKEWAKVAAYQSQRDQGHFNVTTSAIVVFKSRRTAAVAAQTNFSKKEDEWRVSRAPEPNAINWSALCVTGWTVYVRQAITMLLSTSLTIFWIFPITFIMSIVSLKSLIKLDIEGVKPFEFFKPLLDWPDQIKSVVESTLPVLILSLFLNWVPDIFGFFVGISRITSHAERDRLVRDWNFAFVTFSNFLFVAFAGTLLSSFSDIIGDPASTFSILAQNIPKQAAFCMNFIVITTLTEVPRELLQFGRVLSRSFKLAFTAKTQRQREEAEVGEMEMDFVGVYSTSQLVALLGLVYCTIQPFIIPCCMGYFAMIYIVFKYNLCYSYYNEYQDGGRMYGGALYGVWVGLFSHLITMVGVFTLNQSPAQSVLIIIPTVISVGFLAHCRKSFSRVLEHGSALETQDRVEHLEGCAVDVIEDELAAAYEHPGWEELPNYSELENLNGVTTEEDLAKAAEKEAMLDDLITISDESGTGAEEDSLGTLPRSVVGPASSTGGRCRGTRTEQ